MAPPGDDSDLTKDEKAAKLTRETAAINEEIKESLRVAKLEMEDYNRALERREVLLDRIAEREDRLAKLADDRKTAADKLAAANQQLADLAAERIIQQEKIAAASEEELAAAQDELKLIDEKIEKQKQAGADEQRNIDSIIRKRRAEEARVDKALKELKENQRDFECNRKPR